MFIETVYPLYKYILVVVTGCGVGVGCGVVVVVVVGYEAIFKMLLVISKDHDNMYVLFKWHFPFSVSNVR